MKRFLVCLILICCAFAVFAQNVYEVDLNKIPVANDDKTVTFDKATKTVTINAKPDKWNGTYLGLDRMDITKYNIVRVKYKAFDYGFHFALDYDDDTLDWDADKLTYCPTYLNEMVIPLKRNQKKLRGIVLERTWFVPYEKFVIESITFEKISDPQKTDIYGSNEPPVIDVVADVTLNEKLDAWDFVKELGAGIQWQLFQDSPQLIDWGVDFQPDNLSRPTKEQIHFMKEKGFNVIRLQTSPGNGKILDKNYRIAPGYIRNIKQVIDWCMEEDMYVILCGPFAEFVTTDAFKKRIAIGDIHFTGYYVNEKDKKESEKFIKAVWKQYAEAFNNSYDEHLIFETLNEPVDMLHEHAWDPKDNCAVCKKDYAILNDYNQLIVDTIRETGGNNANRFIVVEGLAGKWRYITNKLFKLPKDKAKNKLIPTYHDYSMGGSPESDQYFDYYIDGIKDSVMKSFADLDKAYFSKHIPVIVGEIGQSRRTPILERIRWIKDFMAEASKPNRSCAAVLHVDSVLKDDGRFFSGYYDSWKLKWYDEEFLDTFIYGAQGKGYPLSADFIKKNEVKVESIVGKNLLTEPVEIKNWDGNCKIKSNDIARSTPAKYKFVLEIEKTGSDPRLSIGYNDSKFNWHDVTASLKNARIKGGVIEGESIKVKSKSIEIPVDENLAKQLEYTFGIYFNGKDIILKSIKVME